MRTSLAEHAPGEIVQRAFQVAEGDACARPPAAFHLVELDLVAGVDLLVAVAHAGQDRPGLARGGVLAHGVDLPGGGVRAQDRRRGVGGVKGVPHVARRVMGGILSSSKLYSSVSTSRER